MTTNTVKEDKALVRDSRALRKAMLELVRLYQFRDRDRICCYDISVTQYYAIEALLRRGELTLKQLAAELNMDKSTVSRTIASLVRKKYVRKKDYPEDGRFVLLNATADGRKIFDRIEEDLTKELKDLICDFDPDIRRATTSLIACLAKASKDKFIAVGLRQPETGKK